MKKKCHVCGGDKIVPSLDFMVMFIERGVPEGHQYTFNDAADEYVNARSGDVVVKVETLPHKRFVRKGDNLHTNLEISLKEALLGFKKGISHLDGHEVRLDREKVTQPGEEQRIAEEGMPVYEVSSEKGTLFVTYDVKMPKKLTDIQRGLFTKFFSS